MLHSALVHQCLVNRRGMSSRLPRPVFPVDATLRSLATRNLLRLAGTLHVLEVGDGHNAAIVLSDAGVIKYNGDHVLRAALHVLCGVSCLKLLLLCDHAERATSAREAILATQAASEALGLEAVLVEWRTLAADRYGALVSLQNAPQRRTALDITDQELWAQELARHRNGQRQRAIPRNRLELVTAADRETQLASIREQTGSTLERLWLPAHISRNALDVTAAWLAWEECWRGLEVSVSAQQAAAATRVDERARRARMAENRVTAARIPRVRGATGEGTFEGTVSPMQARLDLAWTSRRFGSWMPHTWYHCLHCGQDAVVLVQQSNFLHLCTDEQPCRNPEDNRFQARQLDWPWQVQYLERIDFLSHLDLRAEEGELLHSEDVSINEQEDRLFSWVPPAPGLLNALLREGRLPLSDAFELTDQARQLRRGTLKWPLLFDLHGSRKTSAMTLSEQVVSSRRFRLCIADLVSSSYLQTHIHLKRSNLSPQSSTLEHACLLPFPSSRILDWSRCYV